MPRPDTIFNCPLCKFHGPHASVRRHIDEEHSTYDYAPSPGEPEVKTGGLNTLGAEWIPFALKEASLHAHKALMSWDAKDIERTKSRARVALGHLTAALEILDKQG